MEMRHAYAMRELPPGAPLEEDDLPDGDTLTSTCGGLIVVDGESQTLRVVHYTAEEYFERSHARDLAAARLSLAKVSLAYLALPNFSDGPCSDDLEMDWRLQQYPFLDYASKHWGEDIGKLFYPEFHLELCALWPHLGAFLRNRALLDVAAQVQNVPRIRHYCWSQDYPKRVPPLVHVARFDMPRILWGMITHQNQHTESQGDDWVTALICAADCGLADNVRVLVEQGADLEAIDLNLETALCRAVRKGAEDAVRVLTEAGADVNGRPQSWSPLMLAVSVGSLELVKILIQAGADVALENTWGGSALSIALFNAQEPIAAVLVGQGATLPRNEAGRRAASVACRNGLSPLVRCLIQSGLATSVPSSDHRAGPLEDDEELEDIVNALTGSTDNNSNLGEMSTLSTVNGRSSSTAMDRFFNDTTPPPRSVVQHLQLLQWSRTPKSPSLHYEIALFQKLQGQPHLGSGCMTNIFADYLRRRIFSNPELSIAISIQALLATQGKLSTRKSWRSRGSCSCVLCSKLSVHRPRPVQRPRWRLGWHSGTR